MLEDPRTSSLAHHMAHFSQATLPFMPQTDGDAATEVSETVEERGVVPRAPVRRAVKITVFHSNREALASALDEDASPCLSPP